MEHLVPRSPPASGAEASRLIYKYLKIESAKLYYQKRRILDQKYSPALSASLDMLYRLQNPATNYRLVQ